MLKEHSSISGEDLKTFRVTVVTRELEIRQYWSFTTNTSACLSTVSQSLEVTEA